MPVSTVFKKNPPSLVLMGLHVHSPKIAYNLSKRKTRNILPSCTYITRYQTETMEFVAWIMRKTNAL